MKMSKKMAGAIIAIALVMAGLCEKELIAGQESRQRRRPKQQKREQEFKTPKSTLKKTGQKTKKSSPGPEIDEDLEAARKEARDAERFSGLSPEGQNRALYHENIEPKAAKKRQRRLKGFPGGTIDLEELEETTDPELEKEVIQEPAYQEKKTLKHGPKHEKKLLNPKIPHVLL